MNSDRKNLNEGKEPKEEYIEDFNENFYEEPKVNSSVN